MSSIDENDDPPGLGLLPKLREKASRRANKHVDMEDGEINDEESKGPPNVIPFEEERPLKVSEDLGSESKGALPPDAPISSEVSPQLLENAQRSSLPSNHEEIDAVKNAEHTVNMQPRTRFSSRIIYLLIARQSVSPEELNHAKSVVLDLLGWGVQPEYLLEYGVSPQAIFTIFTDLHLRLPQNLFLPPGETM